MARKKNPKKKLTRPLKFAFYVKDLERFRRRRHCRPRGTFPPVWAAWRVERTAIWNGRVSVGRNPRPMGCPCCWWRLAIGCDRGTKSKTISFLVFGFFLRFQLQNQMWPPLVQLSPPKKSEITKSRRVHVSRRREIWIKAHSTRVYYFLKYFSQPPKNENENKNKNKK